MKEYRGRERECMRKEMTKRKQTEALRGVFCEKEISQ